MFYNIFITLSASQMGGEAWALFCHNLQDSAES